MVNDSAQMAFFILLIVSSCFRLSPPYLQHPPPGLGLCCSCTCGANKPKKVKFANFWEGNPELSSRVRTRGVSNGWFPDLELSFLFVLPCPFWDFPPFFRDFPDFFGDFPFPPSRLTNLIESTYEEQSRKGLRHNPDFSWNKVGNPPSLETLRFTFPQLVVPDLTDRAWIARSGTPDMSRPNHDQADLPPNPHSCWISPIPPARSADSAPFPSLF